MQTILEPARGEVSTSSRHPLSPSARRSISNLLAPLDRIAANSPSLVAHHDAIFKVGGQSYEISRYSFVGPQGGGAPIRLGLFAAIHGDEPEGTHALVHFIRLLEARPELAAGYCLFFYPVCNPTGFEDGSHASRNGRDLNREFWKNSTQPEVRILETELSSRFFHGIISLHTHEDGDGLYGMVRGQTLARHLLEPALKAAETFLPRDERGIIAGHPANNGMIRDSAAGALSAPPKASPRPFEITLETPRTPPAYLKEFALAVALRTILVEYRKFIAYAQNL